MHCHLYTCLHDVNPATSFHGGNKRKQIFCLLSSCAQDYWLLHVDWLTASCASDLIMTSRICIKIDWDICADDDLQIQKALDYSSCIISCDPCWEMYQERWSPWRPGPCYLHSMHMHARCPCHIQVHWLFTHIHEALCNNGTYQFNNYLVTNKA